MNRYQAIILAAWLMSPQTAWCEPENAKDVKGNFTLVVAGTATNEQAFGTSMTMHVFEVHQRIQPFTITGFKSFQACVGAGKELQARLNTDGYTLDFSCIGVSK